MRQLLAALKHSTASSVHCTVPISLDSCSKHRQSYTFPHQRRKKNRLKRMERWRNRVALVTGASAGIGAAICKLLSGHGMKVVGCARRVDKIEEMAVEFPNIRPYKCDMKDDVEIQKMFDWIENEPELGRVDLCIPNAGISYNASLLQGSVQQWKDMLDVNVVALSLCTQLSVKSMIKHKIDDGQIIFMSSFSGHRVTTSAPTRFYASTKFAVRALLEGWRQEVRDLGDNNIRISCISPGMVETEFMFTMHKDDPEKASQAYKAMQCLQAEDMAAHVRHILELPKHVQIHDILVRPTQQKS